MIAVKRSLVLSTSDGDIIIFKIDDVEKKEEKNL